MHCSNCGKDIPYHGKVCPFCNNDKSGDQALHAHAMIGAILVGGFSMYFGGFISGLVGGFLGMISGVIIYFIKISKA